MLTKKGAITGNIYIKEEKKLFEFAKSWKDGEILFKKDNIKYFEENNEEKDEKLILNGAKESCIYEILSGFGESKQTKISFKEIIYNISEDGDDNKKLSLRMMKLWKNSKKLKK